jgi:C4-dicarboxylate-binding protein DctP
MKKKLILVLFIFLFTMTLGFTKGQVEKESLEKPIVIRMGLTESIDNPIGKMASKFKIMVEENSENKIKVEIYPSLQLGGIREQVEAVQMGNQEIMVCTPAWVSAFVPQMSFKSIFQGGK